MRRFFTSIWGVIVVAVVLIILLIASDRFRFLGSVRNSLSGSLSPIQLTYQRLIKGAQNVGDFFASRKRLSQENEQLSLRIENLLSENAGLHQQLKDINILRSEEEFLSEKSFSTIDARVIGTSIIPFPRVLIVNRGVKHGVRVGAAVITGMGVFVGRIIEVGSITSKVLTLTDPQSSLAVTVQNEQESMGIVKGSHNISLDLSRIPQNDALKAGDLIVTSGTEEGIPSELVIGSVDQVTTVQGELFQSAIVTPAADLDSLSVVAIINS